MTSGASTDAPRTTPSRGAGAAFRRLAKGGSPRWLAAPVLLASNWLFQGMLIMDPAERCFKLGCEVMATALAAGAFLAATSWPAGVAIAAALAVAHTVNWLANGQLPVVLKNLGATRLGPARRQREMDRLAQRAERHRWALTAVHAYGSLARGSAGDRSDLDVRVLRRSGVRAAVASCAFVAAERARATVRLLPLDIYVVDRSGSLGKVIAPDELARPVVIWDAAQGRGPAAHGPATKGAGKERRRRR